MAENDEIITNESGGVQSVGALRWDLIPPEALEALSQVLDYGAEKYNPWNWTFIPEKDHLQHAITHLMYALHGIEDEKFPHVFHALCRAAFAVRMHQNPNPHKDAKPGLLEPEHVDDHPLRLRGRLGYTLTAGGTLLTVGKEQIYRSSTSMPWVCNYNHAPMFARMSEAMMAGHLATEHDAWKGVDR